MIISTKIGQTSFVNENGTRVSATVLDYNSCTVVGNRTIDRDGYLANIIGFLKPKKLNKPQFGASLGMMKYCAEVDNKEFTFNRSKGIIGRMLEWLRSEM